jgi:hypothetical protein
MLQEVAVWTTVRIPAKTGRPSAMRELLKCTSSLAKKLASVKAIPAAPIFRKSKGVSKPEPRMARFAEIFNTSLLALRFSEANTAGDLETLTPPPLILVSSLCLGDEGRIKTSDVASIIDVQNSSKVSRYLPAFMPKKTRLFRSALLCFSKCP